jgi:hypothetical protein
LPNSNTPDAAEVAFFLSPLKTDLYIGALLAGPSGQTFHHGLVNICQQAAETKDFSINQLEPSHSADISMICLMAKKVIFSG